MVQTRLELQSLLESMLGSSSVYFQPPEGYRLSYPCIVYERSRSTVAHADNTAYKRNRAYQVTLMYRDPDYDLVDRMLDIPGLSMDRIFRSDGVYNAVYSLTIL